MSLVDILCDRSELKLSGITFVKDSWHEDFLSYSALYDSALRALSYLQANGLEAKSELVFQVEDNKDFLVIFWACILGGIIPVPLSIGKNGEHKKLLQVCSVLKSPSLVISQDTLRKLECYLENSRITNKRRGGWNKCLLVEDVLLSPEKGNIYRPQEQDIAFIQFSSGSTGDAKGVILTHANLIANIKGITAAARYSPIDSMLSWMPLTHDMGMIGFHMNPLFCGINHYLMPVNLFIRNPRLWLDKLSEHRISVTCSPNFGYRYLLKNLSDNEKDWDLSAVRIIFNGAEPISEKLCQEFNEKLLKYKLNRKAMCPVYGLAEASVAVSMSELDNEVEYLNLNRNKLNSGDTVEETVSNSATFVNVGKPVNYCSIQITDKENQAVGESIIGAVKIKGINVTAGYYNDSTGTEVVDEHGWLNTGDLGFIKDRSLYITGRAKDIIFINGQNYYAHDIEKEAECVEGIELNKIAIGGIFNDQSQTEEVIAFLFHRGAIQKLLPTVKLLKRCVNEKFGFELNKVVPVKDIPRTTSGKLQRFELLRRYSAGDFQEVEKELATLLEVFNDGDVVPPSTAMEERLLRIWQEVLQIHSIGVENNFFHVGGNSLKATELIMKLQYELQVELSIENLYAYQTVRKLSAQISNLKHKEYTPIPPAALSNSYPVSSFQRRIYYAWKIDPDSIAYNMPVAIKLKGKIDFEFLEKCLNDLVTRHDSLRMTFLADEPRLQVCEDLVVKLRDIKCPMTRWDEKLKTLISPFDLTIGPLFRFFLLRDDEIFESVLLLDFHHIVSDGQSAYLFVEELLQVYNQQHLLPVNTSFRDFVVWQCQQNLKRADETAKNYWIHQFSDEVPVLEMPYDFIRPAVLSGEGKRIQFELSNDVSTRLKELCEKAQVSNHSLFFVLYNILLAKYSGQEDIVIGIPVQGKEHPDLLRTHGMFVNNLPIRNRLQGRHTFTDLLKQGFLMINKAMGHQQLAYDDLVSFLGLPSYPGRAPLFDTMFLYQNWEITSSGKVREDRRYIFDPGFSKFDISMEVIENPDHITYAFEYSTQLFKRETILELSEGFQNIIRKVIVNPAIRIADLSPLSVETFRDFIYTYNSTGSKTEPFVTVIELFEKQVKRNPNGWALEFEGKELTYSALDISANQVANALKQKAISTGDIVGIHLRRSPELIIAILGVLKAGAAYLPLETDMPAERVRFILGDSGCKLLISDSQIPATNLNTGIMPEVLAFDNLLASSNRECSLVKNRSTDLVYVIYTSGTTGQPKGVMIEHGSLSNYILWASEKYTDGESCAFALYSSISFDLTITSIFTPLVTGNKMIIYGEDDMEISIEKVVRNDQVDVVKLTPSHLRLLSDNALLLSAKKVKRFIVGGESLDTALVKNVHEQIKGKVEIFNEYGPTEATVGCMIYKFDSTDTGKTVPIGEPIANTHIYLLDKYLQPVPVNVAGEIYIAGAGVARGYLFREALTDEKFIKDPFCKDKKMYKSGDIAKRLPNGSLEYIGRYDNQKKINGNRVELSEIENQVVKFKNIKEAVVLIDSQNQTDLIAYFKPTIIDNQFSDVSLREYLAERLPYFMIPKRFIQVESMPLTSNGKVDITQLRSIQSATVHHKKELPKNDIEKAFVKVWMSILNTNDVETRDNFFELGGDSIKAVQISSRLFEEGVLVKVKDILTYHTIENISRHSTLIKGTYQSEQGIMEGEFAPTPIQSWFFSHRFKNPNYYNQSVLLRLNSPWSITIVERTFMALVEHHDTLRINYDPAKHSFFYNNKHLQEEIIIPQLHVNDDRTLNSICNEIRNSFNISRSLLIKMAVIRKQDDADFLFITAHHLIMDGVSWRIFLEDFYKIYLSITNGIAVTIPEKTASFKDWSGFVNELSGSKEFESEKVYWKEIEQNVFLLPQDFVINDLSLQNSKKVDVCLEKEMTEFLLKGAHKPYGTDVLILLNAALIIALKGWTGSNEFVIELENHGRHLEDLNTSRTIGWFTSMYPVKLSYMDDTGVLIKSVKETLRKVPGNGIGYGINSFLTDKRQATPLSEIRLNYLGQFGDEVNNELVSLMQAFTGLETDPRNVFTTKLEINSFVIDGKFKAEIIYSSKIFEDATVNRLAQSFILNLSALLLHLKSEDKMHFTPSDFTEVNLDAEEIQALFGDA
jgi:amino acid adenylation domain-containing protein/non-ribosomal peptide synthase protein (TIGR01720 family)